MDPRLLKYYEAELQHFREMSGEFASEFPKIAGRLGLDGFECADPYVERLIEAFAFLAARVRLKVDAEFPRFTEHLLELVYPHYLPPTPSIVVVQFHPNLAEGGLADGYLLPRKETAIRSVLGKGDQTPCEYRTAHDVTLWPLEIADADYIASPAGVAGLGLSQVQGAQAALRLQLRTTAGVAFDKLKLDRLPLFLRGSSDTPMRLYEALLANTLAVVVRPAQRPAPWQEVMRNHPVRPLGFEPEEALLPTGERSFDGYRVLHEYFAFPQRYMFVELTGLQRGIRRCEGNNLEIIVLFKRSDLRLDNNVTAPAFGLFCTPAINLFPKRADRIHLSPRTEEHHVIPDRTRPLDFEVYRVTGVTGYGAGNELKQEFLAFFSATDLQRPGEGQAYYAVRRQRRMLGSRQRARGPRSSYIGTEVYVSLVDAAQAPYASDLRQLSVETLCTNRDLPIDMPIGKGATDFTLQMGAPVEAIRCLAGPSWPRPSPAEGDASWNLISHLSLNYLSITDTSAEDGAAALRELLALYADIADPVTRKQIDAVRSVASKPVVRRSLVPGPIAFARGLEVTLTCADEGFEGTGVYLLGAVLDRFFAKYVSVNSFTETALRTISRGEIARWPRRIGQRHVL